MAGKGDTPRPLSVPRQTFAERWALAFGKKMAWVDMVVADIEGDGVTAPDGVVVVPCPNPNPPEDA